MAGFENNVLVAKNMNFDQAGPKPHLGVINAAGKLPIGTGNLYPTPELLGGNLVSPNGSITFGYSSPNITAQVNTSVVTDFHVARYIVASSTAGTGANFTSITAAIAAAVGSGVNSTIAIQPGTYTENFTLPPGINLTAFECDSYTPNVTIIGTISLSGAGTSSISGIRLTTNSANIISLTGANATVLFLLNCVLNCTNNTGISSTGSNAGAGIRVFNSTGFLTTTGIAYHTVTNGSLVFQNCILNNSGASTTASTCSGGELSYRFCTLGHVLTTSGTTASLLVLNSQIDCSGINTTAINANATFSMPNQIVNSRVSSGSAIPISIGAGATCLVSNSSLDSSNAVAVTGSGTLVYTGLVQTATAGTLSATTITPKFVQGAINSTAPPVGMIGQVLSSANTSGTVLASATVTNIASLALTPGIWDVAGTINFIPTGANTSTYGAVAISAANNNLTPADSFGAGIGMLQGQISGALVTATTGTNLLCGPGRIAINANTTYFLNCSLTASVINTSAFGVIRAVRLA